MKYKLNINKKCKQNFNHNNTSSTWLKGIKSFYKSGFFPKKIIKSKEHNLHFCDVFLFVNYFQRRNII